MPTSQEDGIALMEEFTEELNAGNVDSLDEFFADDYDEREDNKESVAELLAEERKRADAFSDKYEEINQLWTPVEDSDGTTLEVWYDVTGVHTGEFIGIPPTQNEVEFLVARIVEIRNGKITSYTQGQTLGFLLDLGLNWNALTDEVDLAQYLTTPEEARSATVD